ncbi:MAG TPA: FAD-dependent oxidoreductase [Dehalococcoidales bacterium]|nr:FAD-dependent oxidoreductase [Dehalococcoidales bacterium]
MVVGAGVSGIQAALDLANSGFKVYLVDEAPAIGGKMAQLDKTFPTNDCSMCILSPKFIECARNPNISIITYAKVDRVDGEAGNFKVTLLKKPRYVDEEKCLGCPTCTEYCPIKIPDEYNEGLNSAKCIYIPFPQAVPAVAVVDPEHCLFLRKKECKICAPTCLLNAIDLYQKEQKLEVAVGSIILALGYETFNPQLQSEYGYKKFSNVVTSLEFERIMSASGPYRGDIQRPSDGKHPKRIAWIQCVGSRDVAAGNTYCSAVCCMYATKQVILSKDHDSELEAAVFHNDVRAYGKGFEQYYERAKNTPGVRYIWSKVSVVKELPETKNVVIRYRLNGTETKEEEFDLVVLSVGLAPSPGVKELANKLSVELNPHGFCDSCPFLPVETSQKGVYVCGVFHAPMDIPDSVTMASGAAALSSQLLYQQRGTLVEEKKYPSERDVSGEPLRIGVFVCRCGTNIARAVDVPKLVQYTERLEGVVHTEESIFACSIDSTNHIREVVKEKELNRVVVAACTPRTHEPVFQETIREAGLNRYLFEFANIREQCSWVHPKDRTVATKKAQELVKMAVAKAKLLKPLERLAMTVNRSALVIGGGISGMASASSLAEQGFETHLVERNEVLGGLARRINHTLEGGDVQAYLQELIRRVYRNPLIHVHTNTTITETSGFVGNFTTKIAVGPRKVTREIAHGVIIVATGAEELKPAEYLYGEDTRVLTLLELEAEIARDSKKIGQCNSLVMILCVGSREKERPYCSRVCCSQAIKDALKLKEINPNMEIYVLYRDMRTFGFKEDYYKLAAEKEIKFIRYDLDTKPRVEVAQEGDQNILRVSVVDPMLAQRVIIDADMLALAVATIPTASNKELSQLFKLPLNEDGFFMEAHMKLRPVDFASDGIFMCGLAHNPKFIDECIAQAQAAASRAATILTKDVIYGEGSIASIDKEACSGCQLCIGVCPYNAIVFNKEDRVAEIQALLCKGCGNCAAACPSGACYIKNLANEHILAEIEALV